jgi:hypothetical protein
VNPITLPCGITLSASTVLTLAAGHIGHFAEQVELCSPGVNVAEARYYLELWKEIRTGVSRSQELGSEQVGELFDACTSGDYDDLLTSDELLAVFGVEGRRAS